MDEEDTISNFLVVYVYTRKMNVVYTRKVRSTHDKYKFGQHTSTTYMYKTINFDTMFDTDTVICIAYTLQVTSDSK